MNSQTLYKDTEHISQLFLRSKHWLFHFFLSGWLRAPKHAFSLFQGSRQPPTAVTSTSLVWRLRNILVIFYFNSLMAETILYKPSILNIFSNLKIKIDTFQNYCYWIMNSNMDFKQTANFVTNGCSLMTLNYKPCAFLWNDPNDHQFHCTDRHQSKVQKNTPIRRTFHWKNGLLHNSLHISPDILGLTMLCLLPHF